MESTGIGEGLAMLATYTIDSSDTDEEMPQSNPTVTGGPVNNLRDGSNITVVKDSDKIDELGSAVKQNSLNQNSTHLKVELEATSIKEVGDNLLHVESPLPSDCQALGSASSEDTNTRVVTNETNNMNPIEERPETILNSDIFIDRRSRKNPYIENFSSDSESDSSSSSEEEVILIVSSSSSSDEEVMPIIKLPEKPKKPPPPPHNKTKGELALEDLPPIEDLHISVPESEIRKIGKVQSIVETQVIVQSFTNEPPYDLDSVLFLSGGKALGKVFDVFGKVTSPLYSIRFNSKEGIVEQGINIGDDVFSAPEHRDVTKFVFTEDLKRLKGSDASWEHNNEPPPGCQDFSDDEEEKMFKQKLRSKHKPQNSEEGENPTPQRKQKFANARNLPPKHFLRPQTFRGSQPNSTPPQNGSFHPTNPQPWGLRNQGPPNDFQPWGHHTPGPRNPPHNFPPWSPNPYQPHFPPPLHQPNSGNPHQNGGFNSKDFQPSSPRFQPLDPARFQHGFLGQTRPPFNPPPNFNFPHNPPSSFNFRTPPPNFRPGGPPPPNFGDSLPPQPTFGHFGPPPPNFGVSVPPPPIFRTFGSPPPNFSVTGPSPP